MAQTKAINKSANLLKAPSKNFYEYNYSSRGSRWKGLPVERLTVPPAYALSYDTVEPIVGLQLKRSENRWRAEGRFFRETWRAGTTCFRKDHYLVTDCTTTGWDHILVTLDERVISELFGDEHQKPDFLNHVMSCDQQVAGILTAMNAEIQAGSPAGAAFSQSLSIALYSHLRDRYSQRGSIRRLQARLSIKQLSVVKSYILSNIGQDLSLSELAGLVQLSPSYFCKAFANTVGATPYRYVIHARIAEAQIMLKSKQRTHCKLWQELGFANQSHFSNVFKRVAGQSPSAFKRDCK